MNYRERIEKISRELGDVRIMEVCGGHTHTIMKYGLREILPDNIKLVSGPGCPVCVTSQRDIDSVIELALNGIKVAIYGDMMRVPGTRMNLSEAASHGADVKAIYSVNEIENEQDRVFFAIGFETTMPMTAYLLNHGINVFSSHKIMPPAMQHLVKGMKIDGFILPGHVSTITGSRMWEELNLGVPQVISGFEPEQMMKSIYILLKKIRDGDNSVFNAYSEVVLPEGNKEAQEAINSTMKPADSEWRGMGIIRNSGMIPVNEELDARLLFRDIIENIESKEPEGCICGSVIRGLAEPRQCPLFGRVCTPEHPAGACMVSQYEGACAIAYQFGRSLSE